MPGEGFLNKWKGDLEGQKGSYTAEPCPGKVDSYRFMTFYLAPKPQSFDRFFEVGAVGQLISADAPHHLLDMGKLGLVGAQELAPRRRVVEEVAHLYRGAGRMGGGRSLA